MITIDYANWGWPQWVLLGLEVLTLAGYISLHGTPRKNYSIGIGIANFSVSMFLLICGGFFS